jgi:hypothetical protein
MDDFGLDEQCAAIAPRLEELQEELEALHARLAAVARQAELPSVAPPVPEVPDLPEPESLWCSGDDWTEATRKLIADRRHGEPD